MKTRTHLAFAALTATALAGCVAEVAEPEPAAAPVDTPAEALDATEDTVTVMLDDFTFVDLPERVPAGTRFTVSNVAASELHELVAFRLADDNDRPVEDLLGLAPPDLVAALGEPVTVLLAAPGGPPIPAVGDGTLAESGRYAILCFIPTGVEPDVYLEAAAATEEGPPQVEGGPPHFVQGMFAELTVE